jgi:GDPmannose 4,6-dehydratase
MKFYFHYGGAADSRTSRLIRKFNDEIYNLAAMSHVTVSFETPEYKILMVGVPVSLSHSNAG